MARGGAGRGGPRSHYLRFLRPAAGRCGLGAEAWTSRVTFDVTAAACGPSLLAEWHAAARRRSYVSSIDNGGATWSDPSA